MTCKRIIFMFLLLCTILVGCTDIEQSASESSVIYQEERDEKKLKSYSNVDKNADNEIDIEKEIPISLGESGQIGDYVTLSIQQVSIEKDRIHSLSEIQLGYLMDIYDQVQSDGTLEDDTVFLTLDITIKSKSNIPELNFSMSDLNYQVENVWKSSSVAYQSDPIYPNDSNQIGITSLSANEEKNLKIGFLVEKNISNSSSIICIFRFADFGSNSGIDSSQTFAIPSSALQ